MLILLTQVEWQVFERVLVDWWQHVSFFCAVVGLIFQEIRVNRTSMGVTGQDLVLGQQELMA